MTTTPNRSRIRLAVVSDAVAPWHLGGKEARYAQLLPRLARYQIDVSIYTMRWWGPEGHSQELPHHALGKARPLYAENRRSIYQGIAFAITSLKLIRHRDFDVIEADHIPYVQLFPIWLVSRAFRVPLLVTWHEYWGPSGWRTYARGPIAICGTLLERLATRLPDRIISASQETTRRLTAAGVDQTRIVTLPAGIDLDEIASVPTCGAPFEVLFAGRLLKHKRADLLVAAAAILAARGKHFTYAIIGSGPELPSLRRQVDSAGLSSLFKFFEPFPESRYLWAQMKAATVVVMPSEREGFGLVAAEALALGTPVITSDHADNAAKELIVDGINGSVFTAGNSSELANAIETWVGRAAKGLSHSNALEIASPIHSADSMAECYAEVVHGVAG